jgi:alpha-beta hydrolase superfamily lysophospholipase
MGEHLGRYQWIAQELAARGHPVWGLDLRGHGRSPGKRGDAPGLHFAVHDLVALSQSLSARSSPGTTGAVAPVVVAHSMGGLLALRAALVAPGSWAKLFLMGPYFRPAFAPQPWRIAAARALADYCPSVTLDVGLRPEQFAHDPEVQQTILRDPLCHQKLSARLAIQLLAQGEALLETRDVLEMPCRIVHGDGDTINCHAASRRFAERQPQVVFQSIRGGAHQIHNDAATRPQVWSSLIDFLGS